MASALPSAPTIGAAFDPRSNAITPLRLGLALLVLFSHAFVAGGFGHDPLYQITGGQMQLGTIAVISFFGLSGFLLARSRETSSRTEYLRNRALRIIPGLWACLALTVAVVVPLATVLGGRVEFQRLAEYIGRAGAFVYPLVSIDGLYHGNAIEDLVNAPLWTLAPEMYCYVVLVVLPIRILRPASVGLVGGLAAANMIAGGAMLVAHLPLAFAVGLHLYVERARVPLSGQIAAGLLAASAAAATVGLLAVVAPLTVPYVAVWAGVRAPLRWRRDISYGVYIYGWPVQQLVAMAGAAALGFVPYLTISLGPVLALAFASMVLVEQPALRLRARASTRPGSLVPAFEAKRT